MNPAEKFLLVIFFKPLKKCFYDFSSFSLNRIEGYPFIFRKIEVIVIIVDSLVQSPPRIDDKGANKGTGSHTVHFEYLCQGSPLRIKVKASVIPDAVIERVSTGEYGRMRRKSEWYLTSGIFKQYTGFCKPVHVGSFSSMVTVTPQMIGSGRVQGEKEDIQLRDIKRTHQFF